MPSLLSLLLAICLVTPASAMGPSTAATDLAADLDANGRYIVVLEPGTDPATVIERAADRDGVAADQTYRRAIRGFTATLDVQQREGLLADPDVAALVPDEAIELTNLQLTPTGISRIGATQNALASIDGADQRVDADVAILDTGSASTPI